MYARAPYRRDQQIMSLFIIFGGLLLGLCLWLTVIDIQSFRLPDKLTFPLLISGLLQAHLMQADILPYAIGAAAGYAAFVGIELAFKRLRGQDGLGRGDAKLLAAAGAWTGWMWLPQIVLISSLTAIAWTISARWRKNAIAPNDAIAFGPFLCFGLLIVWFTLNWP